MMDVQTLRDRYDELLYQSTRFDGEFGDVDPTHWANRHYAPPDGLAANPVVLVEASNYGQEWVTLWPDPEAAAQYHLAQEYHNDWEITMLVDLRNCVNHDVEIKPRVRAGEVLDLD